MTDPRIGQAERYLKDLESLLSEQGKLRMSTRKYRAHEQNTRMMMSVRSISLYCLDIQNVLKGFNYKDVDLCSYRQMVCEDIQAIINAIGEELETLSEAPAGSDTDEEEK